MQMEGSQINLVELLAQLEQRIEQQLAALQQAQQQIQQLRVENALLKGQLAQVQPGAQSQQEQIQPVSAAKVQAEPSTQLPPSQPQSGVEQVAQEPLSVSEQRSQPVADEEASGGRSRGHSQDRSKRKNKAANHAAVAWLCELFPKAFSREQPQALQVGIQEELLAKMPEQGSKIKRALASYTHAPFYLRAIKAGQPRVNLQGQAVGVVTAEDEAFAQERYQQQFGHKKGQRTAKPAQGRANKPKQGEQRMQNKLHQLMDKLNSH
ncbi:ProQ/FINO family protein [Balneatrix alpica]|uniref:ProQ/FINO family protein n=1 Tax=Balneatrix alpica TaxID=75684 RepID=A0ABV5Z941_9GAMM|nr:ProQ/FINO family protein [Balneatrix alpica]